MCCEMRIHFATHFLRYRKLRYNLQNSKKKGLSQFDILMLK